MAPFDIDNVTIEFPDWSSALLNPLSTPISSITQQPTINSGAEQPKTESIPLVLIAVISVAVVALVVAGLLVYHKKHKRNAT